MATKNPRVVTGKVRLSYVNVFQPVDKGDGKTPKYSVSIIIPKSDKETIAKINKAFEEAKAASAGYFGGTVPKLLKGGLRDGERGCRARQVREIGDARILDGFCAKSGNRNRNALHILFALLRGNDDIVIGVLSRLLRISNSWNKHGTAQ